MSNTGANLNPDPAPPPPRLWRSIEGGSILLTFLAAVMAGLITAGGTIFVTSQQIGADREEIYTSAASEPYQLLSAALQRLEFLEQEYQLDSDFESSDTVGAPPNEDILSRLSASSFVMSYDTLRGDLESALSDSYSLAPLETRKVLDDVKNHVTGVNLFVKSVKARQLPPDGVGFDGEGYIDPAYIEDIRPLRSKTAELHAAVSLFIDRLQIDIYGRPSA